MLAPAGFGGRAVSSSVLFDRANISRQHIKTFAGLVLIIAAIGALDVGPLAHSAPLPAKLASRSSRYDLAGPHRHASAYRRFAMSALLAQLAASWRRLRHAPRPMAAALQFSILGQAPILNIGGSDQRVQHQTQCVHQEVTLLTFDQLACIEAVWIDAGPHFRAFHALAVDHAGRWAGLTLGLFAAFHVERMIDSSNVPSQPHRQK